MDRFRNPAHQPTALRTRGPSLILGYVLLRERFWVYDGIYLMSVACIWPKIITVEIRLYGGRLAAASMWMQTHTDVRRCTQMNGRQTASSVWTSRCVQMLDVFSRTFGMHYLCRSLTVWNWLYPYFPPTGNHSYNQSERYVSLCYMCEANANNESTPLFQTPEMETFGILKRLQWPL